MNIALAFGPSYQTPARVFLHSLREYCSGPLQLYLLHCRQELGPLQALCQEFSIQTVYVRPSWLESLPRRTTHSLEAYLPLCLAEALPQLDRVLYLDADMLCLGDLRPLWETDLRGNVLGAVPDLAIPNFSAARGVRCWRELSLPALQPYFNAGMLLIDLQLWRESAVTEAVTEHLGRHRVHFLHQEALNVVLKDRWLSLDFRWNVIASQYQRRYSPAGLALTRPELVHFAGRFKPWEVRTHGWLGRYYRARCPALPHNWRLRCLGFYDCHLRDWLYPLERWYWQRQ